MGARHYKGYSNGVNFMNIILNIVFCQARTKNHIDFFIILNILAVIIKILKQGNIS